MMAFFVLLGFLLSILSFGLASPFDDKPGECPSVKEPAECPFIVHNDCLLDLECPGTSKCCSVGCYRACVSKDGTVASEGKERAECPAVKPGNCPGDTNDQCRWDNQCSGGQKCCWDGCKFMCLGEIKNKNTPICRKQVDIGFIVDTSGSVTHEVFNSMKYLISQIMHSFKVSHYSAHFGIISFSSTAETLLTFQQGVRRATINHALRHIPYSQGTSRLDLALVEASKNMFKKSSGMRKNSKKYLIVLTDGISSNSSIDLGQVANKIRAKDVEIIAVGISHDVNVFTMLELASYPQNAFKMAGYPVDNFSTKLAKMICDKAFSDSIMVRSFMKNL